VEGTGLDDRGRTPGEGLETAVDEGQIQRVLRDIDRLAAQLRKVRNATGEKRGNETQIRALEASLRAKWETVRTLRAKRTQPGGPLSRSRPRLGRGPSEH